MQIAEQVFNIDTAANAIVRFKDGESAYITKRFDLKPDGKKYLQEDCAQLLGRTTETHGESFKYEGSYEEIGALIKRHVATTVPTLEKLFRLVLFNYIISNGDAHLKNFSLIRTENGEYRLSPAYDLLCTVVHTPLGFDTELDLYTDSIDGPHYSVYGCYGKPDFLELASRLGLVHKRAVDIIENYILKEPEVAKFVHRSALSKASKQIYLDKLQDKLRRFF